MTVSDFVHFVAVPLMKEDPPRSGILVRVPETYVLEAHVVPLFSLQKRDLWFTWCGREPIVDKTSTEKLANIKSYESEHGELVEMSPLRCQYVVELQLH